MKSIQQTLLAVGVLAASTASATINIDTVQVSDAGNANDTTGFGGVGYDYHIGTHEVTNNQYTAFLNATAATDTHSLYNSNMGSNARGGISRSGTSGSYTYSTKANMADKPVNYVSFWDAARFANWLTNGQGSGDTETGAYDLTDATAITNNTVTRGSWFNAATGNTTTSEVWAITSENEWYKAAYYDGSGGYYDYPTQSNTAPTVATANTTGDVSNPGVNVANYDFGADWNSQTGNVTTVGSAGAVSHYGTFDQGGNVWEWNDEILFTRDRVLRGGSFSGGGVGLQSSIRGNNDPASEFSSNGFRVSSLAPIPEPSAYAAILGCLGLSLALMRRKGRI